MVKVSLVHLRVWVSQKTKELSLRIKYVTFQWMHWWITGIHGCHGLRVRIKVQLKWAGWFTLRLKFLPHGIYKKMFQSVWLSLHFFSVPLHWIQLSPSDSEGLYDWEKSCILVSVIGGCRTIFQLPQSPLDRHLTKWLKVPIHKILQKMRIKTYVQIIFWLPYWDFSKNYFISHSKLPHDLHEKNIQIFMNCFHVILPIFLLLMVCDSSFFHGGPHAPGHTFGYVPSLSWWQALACSGKFEFLWFHPNDWLVKQALLHFKC